MLNTLLRDTDVMSMANSLEVRPLLLDHRLAEFVFALDDEFKIRAGLLKSILIESVKDLIPNDVWSRPKTGFEMPFVNWMNGVLNERFLASLETVFAKELFSSRNLKQIKLRVEKKQAIANDWARFVFLYWAQRQSIPL